MSNFTIVQGDTLPVLTGVILLDETGDPVVLTDATVKWLYRLKGDTEFTEKAAVIESAPDGQVGYVWQEGDTDVAGDYQGAFRVTFADLTTLTYPSASYIPWTIFPALSGTDVATPVSDFYEAIRFVLQDPDPDVPIYSDYQLEQAIRGVVKLGKLPGYSVGAAGISPSLSAESDVTSYARLIWNVAKRFAVGITSSRFTTRAFSEAIGEPRELVDDILDEIYKLEEPDMAS